MSELAAVAATIRLTIDGREVEVAAGTTIWDAARGAGVDIPVLCHDPRLPPVGVCRVCLVDVGEKKLAASCVREASDGMAVTTRNEKIDACRKGLAELLLSDYPADAESGSKTRGDGLPPWPWRPSTAWSGLQRARMGIARRRSRVSLRATVVRLTTLHRSSR